MKAGEGRCEISPPPKKFRLLQGREDRRSLFIEMKTTTGVFETLRSFQMLGTSREDFLSNEL